MANRYRVYERSVFWFIPVLFVVFLVLLVPWVAHAEGSSWVEGSPKLYEDSTAPPSTYQKIRQCDTSTVTVHVSVLVAKQQQMCLIHSLYFTIAQVDQTTYDGYQSYISFSGDTDFYPVSTSRGRVFYPLENADTVVISGFTTENAGLLVYQDAAHRFTQQDDGSYQFNMSNPTYPSDNTALLVNGWSVSDDGDSLVYGYGSTSGPGNDRYVVLNLKDFSRKTIGVGHWKWFYSPIAPVPVISPSGRYVMLGGSRDIKVWDTSGCGASGLDDLYQKPDPCPSAHIVIDKPCAGYCGTNGFIFNDDYDVEFTFNNGSGTMSRLGYRAAGYVQPTSLEYLALGDSISSGEGDTAKDKNGNKYYIDHTDVEEDRDKGIPREKCHQSTRSYPYLLAGSMDLKDSPGQWGDVACSGAKATDISSNAQFYEGQAQGGGPLASKKDSQTPRLKDFDNRVNLQADALNEFIPGRVEQIEFVRKYKPKVITLTAGANDIDFADKLSDCVSVHWLLLVPYASTCDWATTKLSSLAGQIQNEYPSLKSLYEELYEASGRQAKIYVIGYPQTISNDKSVKCNADIGSLNYEERQMIFNATSYLNTVIAHAANAAGVNYVDISSALNSGRLCDAGQAAMSGISVMGKNELQESFHPNAVGHGRIANAIKMAVKEESLMTYNSCSNEENICPSEKKNTEKPDVPETLGGKVKNSRSVTVTQGTIVKGESEDYMVVPGTYGPNQTVTGTYFSEPTHLGTFTTDNQGGLKVTLSTPNTLPAGYHTLTLEGNSPSGEPLELTQTVEVLGSDPSDRDENGIPDDTQTCGLFLTNNMCGMATTESDAALGADKLQDKTTTVSDGVLKRTNTPRPLESQADQIGEYVLNKENSESDILGDSTHAEINSNKFGVINNRAIKGGKEYSLPHVFMLISSLIAISIIMAFIRRKNDRGM